MIPHRSFLLPIVHHCLCNIILKIRILYIFQIFTELQQEKKSFDKRVYKQSLQILKLRKEKKVTLLTEQSISTVSTFENVTLIIQKIFPLYYGSFMFNFLFKTVFKQGCLFALTRHLYKIKKRLFICTTYESCCKLCPIETRN